MSYQKRKQAILKIVESEGEIDVKTLAQRLDTSEVTVRRDLLTMATDGLIYRTHGGAMKLSLVNNPVSFQQKTALHAEAKDIICRLAAAEIQDGDVIFMDCGSTVFRLCQFIKYKPIKVITNSLPVVYELLNSEVSVNIIGGELDPKRQAVHGTMATQHLQQYRADKAFVGTDGISLANGLSAASEKEADITKVMAAQSQQVYLLCDSSKFEQDKYLIFAPLTLADTLITEQHSATTALYEAQNIKVIARNEP
jgi:DeoR family transcriptional regulator, fructose operon transcriptional repressor